MPIPRSPKDILTTELKEIHSAERQLSRVIPKIARRLEHPALKELLDQRKERGAQLIEALDQAFEEMEVTKSRPKNVAAEGLVEDINEHLEEIKEEKFLAPVMIASLQKVEHYCIAAWGTARSMGRLLNEQRVIETMDRVLQEGGDFDKELTRLAEEVINPMMLEEGEAESEGQSGGRSRGKSDGQESRAN